MVEELAWPKWEATEITAAMMAESGESAELELCEEFEKKAPFGHIHKAHRASEVEIFETLKILPITLT